MVQNGKQHQYIGAYKMYKMLGEHRLFGWTAPIYSVGESGNGNMSFPIWRQRQKSINPHKARKEPSICDLPPPPLLSHWSPDLRVLRVLSEENRDMMRVSFSRARICKHLRIPGIDSKESAPPAYVAWACLRLQFLRLFRALASRDSWLVQSIKKAVL